MGAGFLRARASSQLAWRRFLVLIGACAAVALVVFPMVLLAFDPSAIRVESVGVFNRAQSDRFLITWGMHIGAYVGILGGTVLAYAYNIDK